MFDISFPKKPGKKELICVTGAGGKTSFLLQIGFLLSRTSTVLLTTTTHMSVEEIPADIEVVIGDYEFLLQRLSGRMEDRVLFAASGIEGEKFVGFSPELIDNLYGERHVDVVLVEGDGSKKHPIKGYRSDEPVIPLKTTCQIVVVGAEIFFESLDTTNVFRPEKFFPVAGVKMGAKLHPHEIARILEHPDIFLKNSPKNRKTRRVLGINKMDLLNEALVEEKVSEVEKRLSKYDETLKVSLKCGT